MAVIAATGAAAVAQLLAAIAERNRAASDAADDWGASATTAAVECMQTGYSAAEAMEYAIPLSQLVRASAAETRTLAESDPAFPNLERKFWIHYTELGLLTAIFAASGHKEYKALCDSRAALEIVAFRDTVATAWQLLRGHGARSRPPALPPRTAPTDNREYYILRTRAAKKPS
jgi:hypothetical protein